MLVFRKALLPVALVALTATMVRAQQPECDIDENSPSELTRAILALQVATSATAPEQASRQLGAAVRLLTDRQDRFRNNPLGRNLILGKALVMWMQQPDIGFNNTRAKLGFAGPDGPIDIVATVDSLFKTVETAKPACAAQTNAFRGTKPWLDLVNAAIAAVNANQPDSAIALANRSNVLYSGAPYGYLVLGNVAQAKGNVPDAIKYWTESAEIAKRDTAFAETREALLLNIGNVAAEAAQTATGDDKTRLIEQARTAYETLAAEYPRSPTVADARQGIGRLALARGDTAAFRATYTAQLEHPEQFDYNGLMSAAVSAAQAGLVHDATRLFEHAYAVNRFHRDVLYNLGLMYVQADSFAKALPVARQLLQTDPSNGDNMQLLWAAYSGLQNRYSALARTNARTNRARSAAYADSAKMMADSAVHYTATADSLPVKVTFNVFSASADSATIGGTIVNKGKEAKTYHIAVEFLNKDGNVVVTRSFDVGPVQPNASGTFRGVGTGAGVVAFRYSPIH